MIPLLPRSTRALTLLLALLSSSCRQQEPPGTAPAKEPGRPTEKVKTKLNYVLAKTLDSGHEDLSGIAIDTNDHLYLAGRGGIRVMDSEGELLRAWATPHPATCVAVRPDGAVFVGERTRVRKYDLEGKEAGAWGTEGSERGQLQVVTSLAVHQANVFVADAGRRRILRFDDTGDFISEIGERDSAAGYPGIICPSPFLDCVAAGPNRLIAANPGMLRVETLRFDGTLVSFWGKAGIQPERFCGCCNPSNLALLPDGRVVTAEKDIPRVKVYDRAGKMEAYIGPPHFSSDARGIDLAVDSKRRIWAIDPVRRSVLAFAKQD